MAAVAEVVPEGFTCWLDFNGHLREVKQAKPILSQLEAFECVGGFESPLPQRDAAGYGHRLVRMCMMYICMYVCVYVCMYVSVYVSVCVCVCV